MDCGLSSESLVEIKTCVSFTLSTLDNIVNINLGKTFKQLSSWISQHVVGKLRNFN